VSGLRARPPALIVGACEAGEVAARGLVLSKINKKFITDLDIRITSEKDEGTKFDVDISIEVGPMVEVDLEDLIEQATDAALSAIDEKMKEGKRRAKPG
jgi:hypothetical protein